MGAPPAGSAPRLLRAHVHLFVLVVPVMYRLAPLRWLLRLATPPERLAPYRNVPAETILSIVSRRLRRPRLMRRRPCLRKGLTLFHFLRLAGLRPQLHFGVFAPAPHARRCRAHCWLTLDNRALADAPQEPCAEVLVYPPE